MQPGTPLLGVVRMTSVDCVVAPLFHYEAGGLYERKLLAPEVLCRLIYIQKI